MPQKNIALDFEIHQNTVDDLIQARCAADPIIPELADEHSIRKPESYNRFRELAIKDQFRQRLKQALHQHFEITHGDKKATQLSQRFQTLASSIDDHGAMIFGNMISTEHFQTLINMYTEKLSTDGSKSWIHSYINFGNHPDFLSHDAFSHAFIHPLLIALIAYAAGGPIRMVDARGKDAEPLAIQAQDNMLHIDNTPFRKEFKVILTWERGKPSGPKGQNFVFIPGTHKGVRNCKVDKNGDAWSTEDGSIFTTPAAVQMVFDLQKRMLPQLAPAVVEATHPTMPLTTVFEAGALIHHRYRTKEKNTPRSCVIVAFHRAQDNPGQFLSPESLDAIAAEGSLIHLLMGKHTQNTDDHFISALLDNALLISEKMDELTQSNPNTAKILPFTAKLLNEAELETWKQTVTAAPTVEDLKIKKSYFKLGSTLTHALLTEMMMFDKHGPLDLILYGDGREEIRKWARNRIREMQPLRLELRLTQLYAWDFIAPLSENDLLTPAALAQIADHLLGMLENLPAHVVEQAHLDKQEKISKNDAFRSIKQLIQDLSEAIVRCTSRQTFLSTSLFLFWAADELSCLLAGQDEKPNATLLEISKKLFLNYLSTYVLIEKQIDVENKKRMADVPSAQPRLSKNNIFSSSKKTASTSANEVSNQNKHSI